MKKYKYLLLDLDGTLIYSHEGIFACFRYALEKMGQEELSSCSAQYVCKDFEELCALLEAE